jgi:hypothetical protein
MNNLKFPRASGADDEGVVGCARGGRAPDKTN